MPKPHSLLAFASYLAIPIVVIGGGIASILINPEWALGTADYPGNFRLLQRLSLGVMAASVGVGLVLWFACGYFLLKARQRSLGWLTLAAAGPPGLMLIAALADHAPRPDDRYQHFIRGLGWLGHGAVELAVFIAAWVFAFLLVMIKRDAMIWLESMTTGNSRDAIIAVQDASSGMWAFTEGLEQMYLAPLLFLLWPVTFNLVMRLFARHG